MASVYMMIYGISSGFVKCIQLPTIQKHLWLCHRPRCGYPPIHKQLHITDLLFFPGENPVFVFSNNFTYLKCRETSRALKTHKEAQ